MRNAGVCVLVAGVLISCPSAIHAQQAGVSQVTTSAGQSSPSQSEADKKFKEITAPAAGGVLQADKIVPALEQFIRENPDYPGLRMAYSQLVMYATMSTSPDKAIAIADEAMAKYPNDAAMRRSAIRAKLMALRKQRDNDALKRLVHQLLESETDPGTLQAAAQVDPEAGVKLYEKAIAERKKNDNSTLSPTLDDLTWSYGQALTRTGRKDEGMKLCLEAIDQATRSISDLEALPKEDKNRLRLPMLRMNLQARYHGMATLFAGAGNYDKALEYATLYDQIGDNSLESRARSEDLRAVIFGKLGKSDLELESYTKSYASSMDVRTRDKIRELAAKTGAKPEEIFERARRIRNESAQPMATFELKTLDGETMSLGSIKAKAILVNFFFPT